MNLKNSQISKCKETNKANPWRKNNHKYITKDANKYFENKQKVLEQKEQDTMELTQKFNTLNLQ